MTATTAIDVVTGEIIDSLEAAEQVIADGLETFVRVGNTLMLIKENGWHRDAGYATLDDYCERRWGFSARQGQRLVAAASVMAELTEAADATNWSHLPTNESQTRPLQQLATTEDRVEAWGEVDEVAVREDRAPTAADVLKVVHRRTESTSTTTEGAPPSPADAPSPAGEEGPGTASRPEPSEPDRPAPDVEKIADPDLSFRKMFTDAVSKAHDVTQFDVGRAIETGGDSASTHRHLVKSLSEWCDSYLKATRPNHLRSAK